MAEKSDPKDVADMLEAIAARLRSDGPPASGSRESIPVAAPADDDMPSLGPLDLVKDERAITVTVETRNADADHVFVSLLEGRLLIGLGEGPRAFKQDFALPAPVDEDAAVATFRNGILDVVLPLRRP